MTNKEELIKRFEELTQELTVRRDEQLKIIGKIDLIDEQEKKEKEKTPV